MTKLVQCPHDDFSSSITEMYWWQILIVNAMIIVSYIDFVQNVQFKSIFPLATFADLRYYRTSWENAREWCLFLVDQYLKSQFSSSHVCVIVGSSGKQNLLLYKPIWLLKRKAFILQTNWIILARLSRGHYSMSATKVGMVKIVPQRLKMRGLFCRTYVDTSMYQVHGMTNELNRLKALCLFCIDQDVK